MTMTCNCLRQLIPAIALPRLRTAENTLCGTAESLGGGGPALCGTVRIFRKPLFRQHGTQEICGLDSGNDLAINEIQEQFSRVSGTDARRRSVSQSHRGNSRQKQKIHSHRRALRYQEIQFHQGFSRSQRRRFRCCGAARHDLGAAEI